MRTSSKQVKYAIWDLPLQKTPCMDLRWVTDLGLDSLKVMKILETVEDNFDISIPLNILPDVRTVEDFVLQIQKLNGEGQ